ncbi:MAG TPA: glycosyltransferase family 39 protein [Pirellulaceae bacterium]
MKISASHNRPIKASARREPRPPTPAAALKDPPFTRPEFLLLSAILAAGIALRLFAFSHSAVEHFDEGVYASNLYFGPPDYAYPLQRFYAPPLLPALIETCMILRLPPNVAAILPSFLAGCGTIVAMWWFARSWFGPAAGLTATTLTAFSDFQILFSTAALTDELLGLWLVLAVDAIARSLRSGDFRWAVGAGLYTGLAWWTKYNGWLPLAIEAVGIFALVCLAPPQRARLNTLLACFAVTAVVAAAVWSPYFFSLQLQGGYAPIAANHGRYFVGLTGWLDSASRQIVNQRVLASWLSALGIWIAVSLPGLLPGLRFEQRLLQCATASGLAAMALVGASFPVLTTVSLIGLVRGAIVVFTMGRRRAADSQLATGSDESYDRFTVGLALLAAWWLGMFIMTPCYTAYARLALPFTLAAYLAAPLFTMSRSPSTDAGINAPTWSLWLPVAARVVLVATCAGLTMFIPRTEPEFSRDRRGLFDIAREIHQTAALKTPRVVYVYGEPALFFQLHASGEEIIAPVQDIPITPAIIDGKPAPTFFIAGPNTQHDADFQRNWAVAGQKWKLIREYEYFPSPLVWLDLHDPRRKDTAATNDSVSLYELTTDK